MIETEAASHLMNVMEWAAKAAVALASIKLGFVALYKPIAEWRLEYVKRRKEAQAATIREVLAPELTQLRSIIDDETGCAGSMKDVLAQMRAIFGDLDMFLDVAMDNRERLDETNDLLDAVGFNADRRIDSSQRDKIAATMAELTERRRRRRRALLILSDNPEAAL